MKKPLRTTLVAVSAALMLADRGKADDTSTADQPDRLPVAVSEAPPVYPSSQRAAGNRGEALVDFVVGPDGSVIKAVATKSSHPDFGAAAVEAVLKWKFKPGIKDGRTVSVHLQVPIQFQLERGMGGVPADKVDKLPVPVSQVAPTYPYSLRLAGYRGDVLVDFIVDPDGNVVRADVSRSSHPDFEAPAVEAVLKWKFKPGINDGKAVSVHMRVPIVFELRTGNDENVGVNPWLIPAHGSKDLPVQYQYDEAPKPILTSAPVYPYDLLLGKVAGSSKVAFAIDPLGVPHLVKLVSASQPEFGAAVSAMIEAWRFEPAKKEGKPCWAVLAKEQDFGGWSGGDFPVNESAERLLGVIRRDPSKIVTDYRALDAPIKGRFTPSPVIPESVLIANVRAEAVIEFIVDHAGHAQLPRIISSTNPEFGWAAATAVGRWQYTAPSRDGRAVDLRVRVPVVFSPPNPPAKGS